MKWLDTIFLLKKIAYLESIKDCIENRRSTKDIVEKRDFLNKCLMKLDRQDFLYDSVKQQIDLLSWVLGEK